jgi:short-subunit dehydrogenase
MVQKITVLQKEKWALITGASGGIGKDISDLFAADNINLVLVARNQPKLESIKNLYESKYGIKVEVFASDLSDRLSPGKIYDSTKNNSININYLVNNAGFGDYGEFITTDYSVYEKMIELNILSLTHLTHLYLKGMVERKEGKILNIASTAAFQPIPMLNVYSSTKSFVLNFGEALNNELRGTGVSVTVLCPGGTKTNFHNAAGFNIEKGKKNYLMDSKKVAKIGYTAMMNGKCLIIPGLLNKILTFSVRFAPRFLIPGISKKVMKMTQK